MTVLFKPGEVTAVCLPAFIISGNILIQLKWQLVFSYQLQELLAFVHYIRWGLEQVLLFKLLLKMYSITIMIFPVYRWNQRHRWFLLQTQAHHAMLMPALQQTMTSRNMILAMVIPLIYLLPQDYWRTVTYLKLVHSASKLVPQLLI